MKRLLWYAPAINSLIYRLTGWAVNAYAMRGNGINLGTLYQWKREHPYEEVAE